MKRLGYQIKIKNRTGVMMSRTFGSKQKAMAVLKRNKVADKMVNQGGYRKASTGRLIKINNKYTLVKVKR